MKGCRWLEKHLGLANSVTNSNSGAVDDVLRCFLLSFENVEKLLRRGHAPAAPADLRLVKGLAQSKGEIDLRGIQGYDLKKAVAAWTEQGAVHRQSARDDKRAVTQRAVCPGHFEFLTPIGPANAQAHYDHGKRPITNHPIGAGRG